MTFVLFSLGNAGGKDDLQKYFNETSRKVKETNDPSQKREILNESFNTMSKALDVLENSQLMSNEERTGISRYKAALHDKQDELAGRNGYERVSDGQLNAFSDYAVQDMEQAEQYITISLVAALLIIIILILIL